MEQLVAVLVWPGVVLIIGLVAIFAFRAQIAALIGRTRRVGKGGLETFDAQPAQPTEEKKGVDEFFRSFDNPLLVDAEKLILTDLKDRKIEAPADREKALVRALAASNIILPSSACTGPFGRASSLAFVTSTLATKALKLPS